MDLYWASLSNASNGEMLKHNKIQGYLGIKSDVEMFYYMYSDDNKSKNNSNENKRKNRSKTQKIDSTRVVNNIRKSDSMRETNNITRSEDHALQNLSCTSKSLNASTKQLPSSSLLQSFDKLTFCDTMPSTAGTTHGDPIIQ